MGETFGDGGLSGAGFADEHRIVLGASRKDLEHPANLLVSADDWVEFAISGTVVEIYGILAKGLV